MAYDGFFLTYKSDRETNERYDRIQARYPNFRMVKINLEDWSDPKIVQAVRACSETASTKHFWVIDPDCKIDDDFDFDFSNHNMGRRYNTRMECRRKKCISCSSRY